MPVVGVMDRRRGEGREPLPLAAYAGSPGIPRGLVHRLEAWTPSVS